VELVKFQDVVNHYKAVFLDSYGVLKSSSGLIPGVQATISYLKENDIPFYVLTNDASRSPGALINNLESLGLKGLEEEHMVTSGMMTREYLEFKVRDGKIAYLGTEGSANYIEEVGLITIPAQEVDESDLSDIAAVAFLDDEGFDWQRTINKTINILRKTNVPVVIANSDSTYPTAENEVALATGGLAEIIEKVTGKQFIHFGKPDGQMFLYAYDKLNSGGRYISKSEILMVGDTLHTDILGGNKFGLRTMLTLSGNTTVHQADDMIQTKGIIPDYVVLSIGM
jgi:HAD superfamily hydrolase (TIGR01450 family)